MIKVILDENQILNEKEENLLNKEFNNDWDKCIVPLDISKEMTRQLIESISNDDKLLITENKELMFDIIIDEEENSHYAWGSNDIYYIYKDMEEIKIKKYDFYE